MVDKGNAKFDSSQLGKQAFQLATDLYPFCRSLTGEGVRQTLKSIQRIVPLEIHEVSSGTTAYDWLVPHEWNVQDAYVKDAQGRRVIDFRASNLHLVGYSIPFLGRISRNELLTHIFTDPAHPDSIPYRHTYYKESWGFCIAHSRLASLSEEQYEVCVDTSLQPGHLTYGELVLKGRSEEEVLISTHTCHPSLANDNLSGIAVAALLARCLMQ